ncbi:MAG TPA: sulfatase-like hydrolase/transferase [Thermoanaerobaculia bacterium]|nr:sulfatase-like hydrolase/transferase [Thermoanaerobaculia bacterium]
MRASGVALLCLLAPLVACRQEPPPSPSVVLISIDTLRADRLPVYGYQGVDTPALDRLAAEGIVFERAWSHYPLTLPSHASVLTGLLPPEHGVRDNAGFRLPANVPHLARDLAAAGYDTAGMVSSYVLRAETGIGDGFAVYDDDVELRRRGGLGAQQRAGTETLERALSWLQERAGSTRPFLLFFHLYEPHSPYAAPEPFAGSHGSPYDDEIAAADHVVGELLAALERRGLYEEALVIVLSDHGEGLGDHGEREHGVLLYREALQVPLLVKLPAGRRAGERVQSAAQLVDVYPTVAEACGLELPPGLAGRSLLSLDPSVERAVYAETFYPRLHFGWSELASSIRGDLHYVHGPRPELFDLGQDPLEMVDVLRSRRRAYRRLLRDVEDRLTPLEPPMPEDAETVRRLASLGYLGSSPPSSEVRPDPRERLPVLADLETGMRLAANDRFAEATRVLGRVVAAEPAMVDAWEALARSQQELGELEASLDSYRQALALSPSAPQLALGAARVLLGLDRGGEAAEHALLALDALPGEAGEVLVRAALAEGDLDAAERHVATVLGDGPDAPASARLVAAEVDAARDRLEEALARVEGALAAADDPVPDLHRLRGNLLARLGRVDEAAEAFGRETALFPDQPRAYAELALLQALSQRPEDAVATLRRLVQEVDSPRGYAVAVRTLRVLGDERGAEALRLHGLRSHPESRALRFLGEADR